MSETVLWFNRFSKLNIWYGASLLDRTSDRSLWYALPCLDKGLLRLLQVSWMGLLV